MFVPFVNVVAVQDQTIQDRDEVSIYIYIYIFFFFFFDKALVLIKQNSHFSVSLFSVLQESIGCFLK